MTTMRTATCAVLCIAVLALIQLLASITSPTPMVTDAWIVESGGIKYSARAKASREFEVFNGETWEEVFVSGANIGVTTPGYFPGEHVVSKADYIRWFSYLREMGMSVLRVYTIQRPHFYRAVKEFNEHWSHKESGYSGIWIIHGIWSPEEELIGENKQGADAFDAHITWKFKREVNWTVDVIHGQADISKEEAEGKAYGKFTTDVSPYILGYIVGTEWFQRMVNITNKNHQYMSPYRGNYFYATDNAAPFESWLAEICDDVATYEMEKYKWQRPIGITNWVSTDTLKHPNEPYPDEDSVEVDSQNIRPYSKFKAGYFLSYHVYPYYPDGLRFQYNNRTDVDGKIDPYAGYIHDLREVNPEWPLFITEFGVPSSRGKGHSGPEVSHFDQGAHTETEQGIMVADMLHAIYTEGCQGALVFQLVDEWFKKTWNTMKLETPEYTRAIWQNTMTNEAHFGLVAADPGVSACDNIYVDGDTTDWQYLKNRFKNESGIMTQRYESFDLTMSVSSDASYLFILLEKGSSQQPWDFINSDTLVISFDTAPNAGGKEAPGIAPGLTFIGAEFILRIQNETEDGDQLFINKAYHTFDWNHYGLNFSWAEPKDLEPYKDTHTTDFIPWKFLVSYELFLPEANVTIPEEIVNVGKLHKGITDPNQSDFNSLGDYYFQGRVLEIRIPWMLLGFTDPAQMQVWEYPIIHGGIFPTPLDSLKMVPYLLDKNGNFQTNYGKARQADTLLGAEVDLGKEQNTITSPELSIATTGPTSAQSVRAALADLPLEYTWTKWTVPTWHERRKASFYIVGYMNKQLHKAMPGPNMYYFYNMSIPSGAARQVRTATSSNMFYVACIISSVAAFLLDLQ